MRTRNEVEKAAHVLGDDRWNVWTHICITGFARLTMVEANQGTSPGP